MGGFPVSPHAGNCNYAGVLIVWDRLFGTYVAEAVRKDLYGNAAQPNTFDPLALNLAHAKRMLASGPDGLWRLFFGRRVPAKWVCKPSLLLKPIPPVKADERANGPQRAKWDGDTSQPPPSTLVSAWIILALLVCVVCSTLLLIKGPSKPRGQVAVAGALSAATFASIGQVCDRRKPRAQTALRVSAPALMALVACVSV